MGGDFFSRRIKPDSRKAIALRQLKGQWKLERHFAAGFFCRRNLRSSVGEPVEAVTYSLLSDLLLSPRQERLNPFACGKN
jgi:hypothetical protein